MNASCIVGGPTAASMKVQPVYLKPKYHLSRVIAYPYLCIDNTRS